MWIYSNRTYKPNQIQLTNNEKVQEHLSKHFPNLTQEQIPTGLFLESLKFNTSTEVNFTGYIWQVYDPETYENWKKEGQPVGFIIPEAVDSGSNIEPTFAYEGELENNHKVIVWYVESTVKQKFNYSKYPLDHKTVWIRLWSRDFNRSTILVPDFDAYLSTEYEDAFGYDEDIVLGQWKLLETFFDYRQKNYNTFIDKSRYDKKNLIHRPELSFNIVIERRFMNSFVEYILPLIVIAILTFATLMMITKDEKQASIYGINTSGVIGVCSGLFFLVLLSQIQIRERFSGSKIVYLELFYPLMYLALLGVSANSYLFDRKNTDKNKYLKWIKYEDNIIPKLCYWPAILGGATIVTAVFLLPQNHQTYQSTNPQKVALNLNNYRVETVPFSLISDSVLSQSSYQTLLPFFDRLIIDN